MQRGSMVLARALADVFVAYVENCQMPPFFAAGRVVDGTLAATEMIVTRAHHASANQGWDDEKRMQPCTAGGGATVGARLNEFTVATATPPGRSEVVIVGNSPQATLDASLQAMPSKNADTTLQVYSAATRAMLKQWVMTTAQMDNLVTTYRDCRPSTQLVDATGSLAVIRYPLERRQCSPWFFAREDDVWRLDLVTQQKRNGFGRDNSWHLNRNTASNNHYGFAFQD